MAYPDDGNPVFDRAMETLVANLAAIAEPAYHWSVVDARLYAGYPESGPMPAVMVVPLESRQVSRNVATVRHQVSIDILCALKWTPGDPDWKSGMRKLLADVEHAIEQDPQLGGDVVYIEPTGQQVFDAATTLPLVMGRVRTRALYGHPILNPAIAS